MNTGKIEVLNKAIHALENNTIEYNWSSGSTCNCGIIAQCAGAQKKDLYIGSWGGKVELFCESTDLSYNTIGKFLIEANFTPKELTDLEWLNNNKIAKKANVNKAKHDDKESLIKYLKAWVEILNSEKEEINVEIIKIMPLAQEIPVIKKEYKLVKINFGITEPALN